MFKVSKTLNYGSIQTESINTTPSQPSRLRRILSHLFGGCFSWQVHVPQSMSREAQSPCQIAPTSAAEVYSEILAALDRTSYAGFYFY